jgi:hypothetical protein
MPILLLALAGAVIAAVVGTFWYSDKTPMGKLHMRSLGFDKLSDEQRKAMIAEAKPKMPKMYALQMALSLLTAFAVVFIVTMSVENGLSFSVALGFIAMNWLCFVVPTIGSAILWGNIDRAIAWKKFFSDIASSLVTLVLVAIVASLFV